MGAERPWLLGLSDLVLGSAPPSYDRGLGTDWTSLVQSSIELTAEVAPVVVESVKAGKKKKKGGGGGQAKAEPAPAYTPPPAPTSSIPKWAIPAALGVTAVVGALILTRPKPAPPAPAPVRNPRCVRAADARRSRQ
jgi:hypothetical protein